MVTGVVMEVVVMMMMMMMVVLVMIRDPNGGDHTHFRE